MAERFRLVLDEGDLVLRADTPELLGCELGAAWLHGPAFFSAAMYDADRPASDEQRDRALDAAVSTVVAD